MITRTGVLAAVSALALVAAGVARADSIGFSSPNVTTATGSTSATVGGATFINQGLVGTARLSATLHDFNGETLGSFSGMALDLKTWRRSSGGYTASLYTLPDRGPNNVGGLTTTNYAARLNRFTLTLNPYTGTAAVPATTQQMQLVQAGGMLLRDSTGQLFTGRDPQGTTVTRNGIVYPTPPAGDPGAGKIAMDAEAVTFLNDGSFYVGDEYGAAIYYFDANGAQIGAIQANPDIIPRVNGAVNFNGTNDAPLVPGTTGRRSNQGMEGVSVSPDGTRLFAVLQSAALQDNPTNVAVRRNNTRVLVYDISASRTPTAPLAEYVLQLPVFNNSATGIGAPGTTAAQSEVLALNNTQFLVLSRDGNGRGTNGNSNAIAFKSILLVDTTGATSIAGTAFSNGVTPISTSAVANGSGALVAGITPVQQVELVNLLNPTQLGKFGINTITNPSTQFSLSEKWEAMALAPTLEEDKPNDYFLLVGNDNDFVSSDVDAAGVQNANTALNSPTAGSGDNDNVVLIYRLTLPTYVDPQALAYLRTTGAVVLAGAHQVGARFGAEPALAAQGNLDAVRRARAAGLDTMGVRGWGQGGFGRVGGTSLGDAVDAGSLVVGIERGSELLQYGIVLSGQKIDGDSSADFDISGHSYAAGAYVGLFDKSGFYAQGAAGLANLKLKTRRPASYGLSAQARPSGNVLTANVKFGYAADLGPARAGPYADVLHARVNLDSFTENGAAIGNGIAPDTDYSRTESTLGLEATFGGGGSFRPTARVGYTWVSEGGPRNPILALAAVSGSAAPVALPTDDRDFVGGQIALEGEAAGFSWRASLEARDTDRDASGRITLGFAKAF